MTPQEKRNCLHCKKETIQKQELWKGNIVAHVWVCTACSKPSWVGVDKKEI